MQHHPFTRRCMVRNCTPVNRTRYSDCNVAISSYPVSPGSACSHSSTSRQTPSEGFLPRGTSEFANAADRAPGGMGRTGLPLTPPTGQFCGESSRLSSCGVSRSPSDVAATSADWSSRMVYGGATGSNLVRCSRSCSSSLGPTVSRRFSWSQGVAGGR